MKTILALVMVLVAQTASAAAYLSGDFNWTEGKYKESGNDFKYKLAQYHFNFTYGGPVVRLGAFYQIDSTVDGSDKTIGGLVSLGSKYFIDLGFGQTEGDRFYDPTRKGTMILVKPGVNIPLSGNIALRIAYAYTQRNLKSDSNYPDKMSGSDHGPTVGISFKLF